MNIFVRRAAVIGVLCCALLAAAAVYAGAVSPVFINYSFEFKQQSDPSKPDLEPWTIANKTGDKIKCGLLVPVATQGDCVFQFKGGMGESAVLAQLMSAGNIEALNDLIAINASQKFACMTVFIYSESPLTDLKGVLKVKVQGEVARKAKLFWTGTTPEVSARADSYDWRQIGCFNFDTGDYVTIEHDETVQAVKAKLRNRSAGGKFFIDEVTFSVGEVTR